MNKLTDLLLVGVLTAGVGAAASFAGSSGAIVLGSLTGAVVGTTFINKRQEETEVRLRILQEWEFKKEQLTQLKTELPKLETEVKYLREAREKLGQVEGKLTQKQEELKQVDERIGHSTKQKQRLEQVVTEIQQQNPNLSTLQELQKKISQFSLNKSELEGQITELNRQLELLQQQQQSLLRIEADYATKKSQHEQIVTQLKEYRQELQDLETKKTELELLRATYDGLFQEKQTFEERVNQLRPEIDRLEAEKQQILIEIQSHQQEFERLEELRRIITNLKIQKRDQEAQFKELERETQAIEREKAELENRNLSLQQEKARLEQEIKEIKGEINELENSTEMALRALKTPLWTNLPTSQWNLGSSLQEEQQFLNELEAYLKNGKGLIFPRRVINAFHTSLKVQDISALVILAGISGTGKSELPQQYASYIGAQQLTLAVQPRWDSPQDLQGFYNYIEKKFKPTELIQGLYQYNHDSNMNDRMVIVLLDEMNLARVEYYFSEFLSKLETRRNQPTYLDIDVGSLPIQARERQLKIPNEFLFVGTMNEDETTQTLSDKVLDRANVLTFGKPNNLALREDSQNNNGNIRPSGYLPYSKFKGWMRTPDPNSAIVSQVKQYLDEANQVMEKMGHPFAHRVYQAITKYVVNYPGVTGIDSDDFKAALADQFGQKLLPKWRGLMVDDYHEEIQEFSQIIQKIGDLPLINAWNKANEDSQRSGQFQWKGFVYPE